MIKKKQITIVDPLYLKILKKMKKEKFHSVCGTMYCDHPFILNCSSVIKSMKPHIQVCLKRKEKRGAYPFIFTYCEECGYKFFWDLRIYSIINGDEMEYRYEFVTSSAYGTIDQVDSIRSLEDANKRLRKQIRKQAKKEG